MNSAVMTALHNDLAEATLARDVLIRAAEAAGSAAMAFFRPGATTRARISYKAQNSPVTEADYAADDAIRAIISAEMPDVALFSEEMSDGTGRFTHARIVVVDPIDGTRAFIQGRDEWCVSIALLVKGAPVAGVIHAPARKETFAAVRGAGATLNGRPLPRLAPGTTPLRITGPNRLVDTLTEHWPATTDGETLRALAYRLASVAAGRHDVGLATLGAHDWDIAAADLILTETGCALRTLTGGSPVYNAANPVHPALIAAETVTAGLLLAALAEAGVQA